jgi:hypothetical protein
VVRFFVIYDLARNKTGSVKDGMTELYKNDKEKTCIQLNKIKENQNHYLLGLKLKKCLPNTIKFFRNSVIFDNIFLCKCKNT